MTLIRHIELRVIQGMLSAWEEDMRHTDIRKITPDT